LILFKSNLSIHENNFLLLLSTSNNDVRKRTGNQGNQSTNKEGNIYRLRNQDDDDDENNTWNGNSTQQM
jgi:hypothetical protein